MHHIFTKEENINIQNKEIILDKQEENFNHLANVLRIKTGEKVLVSILYEKNVTNTFDYLCEVREIDSNNILLCIIENCEKRELDVDICLIQGLPKQEKLEFIVDATTELGIKKIIPTEMKNCVVKVDDKKFDKKIERLRAISKSASEQSKRGKIPEITNAMSFNKALDLVNDYDYKFLFYEDESCKKTALDTINIFSKIKHNQKVVIVIGPEGGFDEKEVIEAKRRGFETLSLGKRILRTEIAAITAVSNIMMFSES